MKKIIKKTGISLLALGAVFILSSCETDDDNKIAEAQACLDGASTPTQATTCLAKISGLESEKASRLRCGGTYMQRGFTSARFVTAFDKIKNSGSNDPAMSMAMELAFDDAVDTSSDTGRTDLQDADYVFTECAKSDSVGLMLLSGFTRFSTLAVSIGGGCDSSNITQCLTNLNSSGANQQVVGEVALSLADTYCTGSNATSPTCQDINTAVAQGGTAQDIGTALLTLFNN